MMNMATYCVVCKSCKEDEKNYLANRFLYFPAAVTTFLKEDFIDNCWFRIFGHTSYSDYTRPHQNT